MPLPRSAEILLAEASRARAAGDLTGARQRLEALVAQAPRHVEALLLLRDVFRDLGERDLALARLRDAAEAGGPNPAIWRMLIEDLVLAGQKSRARKLAAKAPLRPADRKALVDLAGQRPVPPPAVLGSLRAEDLLSLRQLVRAGRVAEARARAEAMLRSHGDSAALWTLCGTVALTEQRPDRAVDFLRQALARAPDHAEALAHLGLAFGLLGRAPEAAATLARLLSLDPDDPVARTNLASALIELDRIPEALTEIDRVLARTPSLPGALGIKAMALVEARRFAEARDLLRALALREGESFTLSHLMVTALSETEGAEAAIAHAEALPDPSAETLRRVAMLKAELGRIEAACADLRAVAQLQPGNALAYRDFGLISAWTPGEPMLALLERQIAASGPMRLQDRAALGFALGRARLDMGDTKGAFEAFRRANEAQDRQLPPDMRVTRPWDEDIAQAFTAERIAGLAAAGIAGAAPVFIVGMPRSGSTLTEQVLAAHPDVVALGEDSGVADPFFRSEAPDISQMTAAAQGAAAALLGLAGPGRRPVDKNLRNFLILGQLAAAFPKARFLHTTRDPRDTCLSIFANPLDPVRHPYSVNLERLADFYVRYRRLMDHWRGIVGDRILDLPYEALVADPEPRIRALIDWLGLPWHDACLRPEAVARRVKTISLGQVRKAISAGPVARWTAFAEELSPLTAILDRGGVLP